MTSHPSDDQLSPRAATRPRCGKVEEGPMCAPSSLTRMPCPAHVVMLAHITHEDWVPRGAFVTPVTLQTRFIASNACK